YTTLFRSNDGPPVALRQALELASELVELIAAAHLAMQLVGIHVAASELASGPASRQDREGVADRQRVGHVVGDEDHAEPAVAGRDDVAQHDGRLLDTERRRG